MLKNTCKKAGACIVLMVMAFALLAKGPGFEVMAAENETRVTKPITASFVYWTPVSWDVDYSDDYFFLPSDQYHHKLAQLSCGLALSAFRDTSHKDAQDDNLISFLQDAGFEDIDTHPYKVDATSYSAACGIGHKKIGDTEVVALAVCGGNYHAEWASNLTLGDEGVLHKGFSDSAQIVAADLDAYLEKYSIGEDAKLWITGYSRGAAISNILAAECTDSGRFKDVYAYTFATPRTTKEPGDYRNIFNIIRKDDPVPKVPLADWGYQRNGNDMLLVSSETDADIGEIMLRTADLYQEMAGSVMVRDAEINNQVRTILDYLLYLLPDSESYVRMLQPLLVDIVTGSGKMGSTVEVLKEALSSFSARSEEQEAELKELMDYLQTLVNFYLLQDTTEELPPILWNPDYGLENLLTEHVCAKYLAQMHASDDPDDLFSDNTDLIHLVIYGVVDAQIYDKDTLIKTVLADGTELADGEEASFCYPKVDRRHNKLVISLSADRCYSIRVTSKAGLPHVLAYTGNLYSGDTVRAKTDALYFRVLNYGDSMRIVTSGNDRAIDPEKSDYDWSSTIVGDSYSPSVAVHLEYNKVAHLTISGVMTFLMYLLVFLLIQLVASIALAIVRRKKAAGRNIPFTAVWHCVNVFLFTFLEVSVWYFISAYPLLKVIPMILVLVTLLVFAWKLYRQNKSGKMLCFFGLYVVFLAAFGLLNGLFAGKISVAKTVILVLIYIAFFTSALILFRRQWQCDR